MERQSSVTTNPEASERAGAELAATLRPGDVVLVSGELGAGKTTFVRGALRALGVAGPITSPTFVVGHAYEGTSGPVSHLDLYRLADLEGEDPALLDDYLRPDSVAFVEWPAAGAERLGRPALSVRMAHLDEGRRVVEVDR
jgi:tRNA threonylcarbamoyladenosine biosynthesis protein TsaE